MSELPSRHQLREDATFRGGVRLIAAGLVVVSTWLGLTLDWVVTHPIVFRRSEETTSIPRAFALATGTVAGVCAIALVIGLLGATRWRRSMLTAWATASLATAASVSMSVVERRAGALLFAIALLVVGVIWWALGVYDGPGGGAMHLGSDP